MASIAYYLGLRIGGQTVNGGGSGGGYTGFLGDGQIWDDSQNWDDTRSIG